ncbi:HTH-type transcriptional regulator PrtR [Psychrobacter pasteurii]|uniref:HTH-type transcriptional regulator PrtR n=1 Tax=Psychrobacter pasteurii TaxID=1945520 RepID=A0A1R4EF72_9GAMM|nr:XRE family transcriptional regulator [Psychrobacter pasteurii]SJM37155.1 HTH-type transcriptional regulator PrtR [Psychrobacter pasteurii]
MNTLPERLKYAREQLNMSQSEVAEAVGMKQPSYYQLESGKTQRSRYINEIANVLKVDVDWLVYGKGKAKKGSEANQADLLAEGAVILIGGSTKYPLVKIPYLDIKASCGPGYVNEENPEAHTQSFTVEFLRNNNLPTDGKGLILMHACSDSMGYTIPHGTLMLVNTNESEYDNFINNKIYVFNADGEMICKRAVKNLDGSVVLKSDNADKDTYPDQIISRDTFSQFRLFGRVRYTFAQH